MNHPIPPNVPREWPTQWSAFTAITQNPGASEDSGGTNAPLLFGDVMQHRAAWRAPSSRNMDRAHRRRRRVRPRLRVKGRQ